MSPPFSKLSILFSEYEQAVKIIIKSEYIIIFFIIYAFHKILQDCTQSSNYHYTWPLFYNYYPKEFSWLNQNNMNSVYKLNSEDEDLLIYHQYFQSIYPSLFYHAITFYGKFIYRPDCREKKETCHKGIQDSKNHEKCQPPVRKNQRQKYIRERQLKLS